MRLRFAVSGEAAKPEVKEQAVGAAAPDEKTPAVDTTAPAVETKASNSEAKTPESGTVEPADTTNNETKIEAASGN